MLCFISLCLLYSKIVANWIDYINSTILNYKLDKHRKKRDNFLFVLKTQMHKSAQTVKELSHDNKAQNFKQSNYKCNQMLSIVIVYAVVKILITYYFLGLLNTPLTLFMCCHPVSQLRIKGRCQISMAGLQLA